MKRQQPDAYPDNNPKTLIGLTKPTFHAIPTVALLHLGAAMADGKRKYGLTNWRDKEVTASIYFDAKLRHSFAWWDGENCAPDSLVHHLGHSMACDAIVLDAIAQGKLVDDRPPIAGMFASMCAEWTKKN